MLTKKIKITDLVPMKDPVGAKGGKKHGKALNPDDDPVERERKIVPPFYIP